MHSNPFSAGRDDTPLRYWVGVVLVAALVALAWLGPVDDLAKTRVDDGLKRALATFAVARTLNAVISVVQGTEVSVQAVGGVTLAPGQVLDPLNDLIEQFSALMLGACIAFGVFKVALAISSDIVVTGMFSVLALAWVIWLVRGGPMPKWVMPLMLLVVMIRFAMPAVIVGSDLLFEKFLEPEYVQSKALVSNAASQLETLTPPENASAEAKSGVVDRLKNWWAQTIDAGTRFQQLKAVAEQTVEHAIRLAVVFLMQTLLLPVFLFWLLARLVRGLLDTALPVR
ncbi:MAG: hypothetical protein H6943_09995 [Zoogloeaceae bacterium]|nr:hypothetical protein [Zoogloeaceae bacterium]